MMTMTDAMVADEGSVPLEVTCGRMQRERGGGASQREEAELQSRGVRGRSSRAQHGGADATGEPASGRACMPSVHQIHTNHDSSTKNKK